MSGFESLIEIKPHVSDDGTVFDQNQVFFKNKRIGYCGTQQDRPINFIVKVSPELENAVKSVVEREVGQANKVSHAPELVDDPEADEE